MPTNRCWHWQVRRSRNSPINKIPKIYTVPGELDAGTVTIDATHQVHAGENYLFNPFSPLTGYLDGSPNRIKKTLSYFLTEDEKTDIVEGRYRLRVIKYTLGNSPEETERADDRCSQHMASTSTSGCQPFAFAIDVRFKLQTGKKWRKSRQHGLKSPCISDTTKAKNGSGWVIRLWIKLRQSLSGTLQMPIGDWSVKPRSPLYPLITVYYSKRTTLLFKTASKTGASSLTLKKKRWYADTAMENFHGRYAHGR